MIADKENRCPYIITKRAGDESRDFCDFTDETCVLVSSQQCAIYNEWLQEREK